MCNTLHCHKHKNTPRHNHMPPAIHSRTKIDTLRRKNKMRMRTTNLAISLHNIRIDIHTICGSIHLFLDNKGLKMDIGFNTEIVTIPAMKGFLILILSFIVTVIISILKQKAYKKINYQPSWKFLGIYLQAQFVMWLIQIFLNTGLYIGMSFINFANPHSLSETFIIGILNTVEEIIALIFIGLSAESLRNEHFKDLDFMENKDYNLFLAVVSVAIFVQLYLIISCLHSL